MLYKILVMLHLLGASLWIGGRFVLLAVALPRARRTGEIEPLQAFEKGVGRLGLGALAVQLVTGLWLVTHWLGGLGEMFQVRNPIAQLALLKIALLVAVFCLAGYAYHRLLPRLEPKGIGALTVHTWISAILSVLLLVFGVGLRTGGLW